MSPESPPSFSKGHRWSIGLNVLLAVLAALALVLMANYLAARHYGRFPLSFALQPELSPLTRQVIAGLTNPVQVTVYYDRDDPLYTSVWGLLREYQFLNARILIRLVDYVRDPSAAQLIKSRYKLSAATDKDLVIFDCQGRTRIVYASELSDLDIQPLLSGKSREVRRTHFKGEMLFTSAIISVNTPRPLKAYFLRGHGEHNPQSDETLMGYSKFADLLRENDIQFEALNLAQTSEVPADCNLLIVAGPTNPLLPEEVDKIDRYLKQGGRLLCLFNFYSVERPIGLERILEQWGMAVGQNVVLDPENSITGKDMVVSQFAGHPLSRPFAQSRGLYLVLPRSIAQAPAPGSPDAPQSQPLAMTGSKGRVITRVSRGELRESPGDFIGSVPLMQAVEKGGLRGVRADRGATRIVAIGESIFLGNETIDKLANREFASHALNWLFARNELLGGLGPRPIKEYKLTMTQSELAGARWIFLVGMPGSVLLLGGVVWIRRRH